MKSYLVAADEATSERLRAILMSLNFSVQSQIVRQPGENLSPWVRDLTSGVLIVCSRTDLWAEDSEVLSSITWKNPELDVILIIDSDSRELLMQAMRSGIREVVLSPFQESDLRATLQRVRLHANKKMTPDVRTAGRGQMLAFISCKGGCGATFLATNMAYLMAHEFNRDCAFIDLDLQSGDASFYMGHDESKNNITDLTQQIDRLDLQLLNSCMQSVRPHLTLLGAPEDPGLGLSITASQLEQVLSLAVRTNEFVFLDLDSTIDAQTLKALDMADRVYVVMQSSMPVIRNAQRLIKLFRSLGYGDDKLHLIVNKYEDDDVMDASDIEKSVGLKVHCLVPNQVQAVTEALNLGKPLDVIYPKSGVLKALRKITSALLNTPVPQVRSWLDRWIGKAA